jgi:LacI family transcriptional regulator
VLRAARQVGYTPRTLYRQLGVVLGRRNPRMPMGYTHAIAAMLEELAYARGMGVEIIDVTNLDQAYDCRIEAVIGVVFNDTLLQLREVPNLPVVVINHPLADRGIHSVYTDHAEQGRLAAQHLLERGHRRIAFLGNLRGEWGDEQRLLGYTEALEKQGLAVDPALVRFASDGALYDPLWCWVRAGVTAVLNLTDDAAAEVLHILNNVIGLGAGREISTVTIEDVPIFQYFSPPQTVIRQPLRELARLALDHALRLAADPPRPGRKPAPVLDVCLHGELIARESVADLRPPAPAASPRPARATGGFRGQAAAG